MRSGADEPRVTRITKDVSCAMACHAVHDFLCSVAPRLRTRCVATTHNSFKNLRVLRDSVKSVRLLWLRSLHGEREEPRGEGLG